MNQWFGSIIEVGRRVPGLAGGFAFVWFLLPFLAQMVVHPDDVIRLQHWMEGTAIPSEFGAQQLATGELFAALTITALGLLLLGLLTVLYHRLQFALTVWPIALFALGVVGNLIWYRRLGFVDLPGIVAGLFPAGLTVLWQRAAEGWAQDFVFGRGNRPRYLGVG